MGYFDHLGTLADQGRCATPKHAMKSRLDEKTEKRKDDAGAETKWRAAVWKRDKGKCRWCRREVVKSLELRPERGECHHVTSRAHAVTRWDPRNGVLLCKSDHDRITGKPGGERAFVVAARTFVIDGREYPDASGPIHFKVVR